VLDGLREFAPFRAAKLPPWSATRVAECGAGTLVLIPARPDGTPGTAYDAAAAAGVAANRLRPDLVLALDVVPDTTPAGRFPLRTGGEPVADWLAAEGARRVPDSVVGGEGTGPMATGAYAAARIHGRPFLALEVPSAALLPAAARALLAAELR